MPDLKDTIMPLGKHKGLPLDKVPLRYLDWLIDQEISDLNFREKLVGYLSIPYVQRLLEKELGND